MIPPCLIAGGATLLALSLGVFFPALAEKIRKRIRNRRKRKEE